MVRNRALSLVTRGLLAGSAIALVTNGLIQVDSVAIVTTEDVTHRHTAEQVSFTPLYRAPEPELVTARPSGGTPYISYIDVPKHYQYLSQARFILVSDSEAWFEQGKPIDLKIKPRRVAFGWYDARVDLQLSGDSKATHFDLQADDEEIILMLALDYFSSNRNVF